MEKISEDLKGPYGAAWHAKKMTIIQDLARDPASVATSSVGESISSLQC